MHVDNEVALFAINKGVCRNQVALGFIRELALLSLEYNFTLTAKYITSKENVIADALSRLDNPKFALVAAEMLVDWSH